MSLLPDADVCTAGTSCEPLKLVPIPTMLFIVEQPTANSATDGTSKPKEIRRRFLRTFIFLSMVSLPAASLVALACARNRDNPDFARRNGGGVSITPPLQGRHFK